MKTRTPVGGIMLVLRSITTILQPNLKTDMAILFFQLFTLMEDSSHNLKETHAIYGWGELGFKV